MQDMRHQVAAAADPGDGQVLWIRAVAHRCNVVVDLSNTRCHGWPHGPVHVTDSACVGREQRDRLLGRLSATIVGPTLQISVSDSTSDEWTFEPNQRHDLV
jgi:hypothetical protein